MAERPRVLVFIAGSSESTSNPRGELSLDWLWELFKGLGAAAGLGSLSFLIWDRAVRAHPSAQIIAIPFRGGARHMFFQVVNRSERPILVELADRSLAGHFSLAADDSLDAMIAYVEPGKTTVAIDAGTERRFPLIQPPDFDDLHQDSHIVAEVWWRFAQPVLWHGNHRLRRSIPKRDFLDLRAGQTKRPE